MSAFGDTVSDSDTLLDAATDALQRARQAGGDRVEQAG